jgi:hypothetical protein
LTIPVGKLLLDAFSIFVLNIITEALLGIARLGIISEGSRVAINCSGYVVFDSEFIFPHLIKGCWGLSVSLKGTKEDISAITFASSIFTSASFHLRLLLCLTITLFLFTFYWISEFIIVTLDRSFNAAY